MSGLLILWMFTTLVLHPFWKRVDRSVNTVPEARSGEILRSCQRHSEVPSLTVLGKLLDLRWPYHGFTDYQHVFFVAPNEWSKPWFPILDELVANTKPRSTVRSLAHVQCPILSHWLSHWFHHFSTNSRCSSHVANPAPFLGLTSEQK